MALKFMSVTLILIIALSINFLPTGALEDSDHWKRVASEELKQSLLNHLNEKVAKNVVIFVGDGMSPDTVTASRIYRGGEASYLAWEKFPHVGLLKTYNTNKQVPDSASTATALFGGVKTNYKVLGVDANIQLDDCDASLKRRYHVNSILSWAQAAGKDTGFVTTTRVTHATPAALYAHCPNRRWECEATMPKNAQKCKDIARQLVEDEPGKNIKVIMGGGRQCLKSNVSAGEFDPIDTWACYSSDKRDLMRDWARDKQERKLPHAIVQNNRELNNLDYDKVEFLLGIFANGHLSMDWNREKGPKGQPSLEEMTVTATKILRKAANGYVLVVEGGLIDFAHHRGHAAQALLETVRMSDAVNATLNLVDTKDTLVIVTSDHTHAMNFNGNPDRGTSILGIAQPSKYDKIPYTTLTYSTGGLNNLAYEIKEGNLTRKDPSKEDTKQFNYSQQAVIVSSEAHHGGGDVPVYAKGPYAHLFHTTHEQNYVAHVIAYASKIGPYRITNGAANHESKWNGIIIIVVSTLVASVFLSISI